MASARMGRSVLWCGVAGMAFGLGAVAQTAAAHTAGTTVASNDPTDELMQALRQAEMRGTAADAALTNDLGPAGIVPYTRGFNLSVMTTGEHDSSSGWSSVMTPAMAFRFNRHWSLTLNVPVYTRVNVPVSAPTTKKTAAANATTTYETQKLLLGDTQLVGGFEGWRRGFEYELTTSMGLPSGDDKQGLGAGQVTYNVNAHVERPLLAWLTPQLELGVNDSNILNDVRVKKSYTDVGTNAHFEVGFGVDLPFGCFFNSDAYEELPLGTQTVTSTTTNGKKGKQLKTITTSRQVSIGEDNGFTNTLDVPLNRHVTLSGFYNRSLRNRLDTAGVSLTFLLRGTPRAADAPR